MLSIYVSDRIRFNSPPESFVVALGSPPSPQRGIHLAPRRGWKQYQPLRDLLSTREPRAYWISDSDRPNQARNAFSTAAAGGFYPHCPSLPGRLPDSREAAVRFHNRRPGCTGLAASAGLNGQVDICYAQGANNGDGRDAAPCFRVGTTVPLCGNPGLGSAPAACCDRHGVRTHRIG